MPVFPGCQLAFHVPALGYASSPQLQRRGLRGLLQDFASPIRNVPSNCVCFTTRLTFSSGVHGELELTTGIEPVSCAYKAPALPSELRQHISSGGVALRLNGPTKPDALHAVQSVRRDRFRRSLVSVSCYSLLRVIQARQAPASHLRDFPADLHGYSTYLTSVW